MVRQVAMVIQEIRAAPVHRAHPVLMGITAAPTIKVALGDPVARAAIHPVIITTVRVAGPAALMKVVVMTGATKCSSKAVMGAVGLMAMESQVILGYQVQQETKAAMRLEMAP